MAERNNEPNPMALIAVGICFIGSGVAISAALHLRGGSGAGIGLIGMGVVFLVIGITRKRKLESEKSNEGRKARPTE